MSEEIRPALSAEEWAAETGPGNVASLLTRLHWAAGAVGVNGEEEPESRHLRELAARIASLLPPREP